MPALAAKTPQVRGVVGWVDLTAPDVADQIAALALPGGDRLVALRHQVQRETDPRWLAPTSWQIATVARYQAWCSSCSSGTTSSRLRSKRCVPRAVSC